MTTPKPFAVLRIDDEVNAGKMQEGSVSCGLCGTHEAKQFIPWAAFLHGFVLYSHLEPLFEAGRGWGTKVNFLFTPVYGVWDLCGKLLKKSYQRRRPPESGGGMCLCCLHYVRRPYQHRLWTPHH